MSYVTPYISGTREGTLDGYPILRDWQHAARFYLDGGMDRAPKFGFLYFVQFNFNDGIIIDRQWAEQYKDTEVGLFCKRVDLPKFTVATETLNQYNRKTVVQTKLTYGAVNIELHDDNSNTTHKLWLNYFKHYYADSNYGDFSQSSGGVPAAFQDTKFGNIDYTYGRYSRGIQEELLKSIDIYVLHKKEYTKFTLVNPKITEWKHDSLNQSEGTKTLANSLTVAYETVLYDEGIIVDDQEPQGWKPIYYDSNPSPYGIAGNPVNNANTRVRSESNVRFDEQGRPIANEPISKPISNFDVRAKSRIYGRVGGKFKPGNPLLDIAAILAKNYVNKSGLTRQKGTTYNIASSALTALTLEKPGKFTSPPNTQDQPGIFNLPGGVGINIFKGFNTSVDGKIRANPAAILFPPRG